jgi:hypothetical protein
MSINSLVSNPTILNELSNELSDWVVVNNNITILNNGVKFTLSTNGSLCMLSCNQWYAQFPPISGTSQEVPLTPSIPLQYLPSGINSNNFCNTPIFLGVAGVAYSVLGVVGINQAGNFYLHFPGSAPSASSVIFTMPTLIWNYKIPIPAL